MVAHQREHLTALVDVFYDRGLELVARLTDAGDVAATIAFREVAALRLRIDGPSSAYFFNTASGLRIDLLFDFPVAGRELGARAARLRIRGHLFAVASERDLLELKRMARRARSVGGDSDDIAFLEARLRT